MSNKLANLKSQNQNTQEEARRKSEWSYQCQAVGCELKPSVMRGGFHLCAFHNGESEGEGFSNWGAISEAIKNNINLIKKAYSLVNKDTKFWSQHTAQLEGWDFCPMKPNEWPSQYTTRLLNKVVRLVHDEAKEAQANGFRLGIKKEKPKGKPKGMKSILEIAESLDAMREK